MKIYRANVWVRFFFVVFSLLILIIGGMCVLIYDKEANLFVRTIIIIGIVFVIGGINGIIRGVKITIDDEKIEVIWPTAFLTLLLLKEKNAHTTLSLDWDEIGEVQANYVLYPESPIIILKPKVGVAKKRIEFYMAGVPIQLLKDILSYLPNDAEVSLYPYLEKMLKRKPDSKRKIAIIAILLILMVIAGFLFSWFILK